MNVNHVSPKAIVRLTETFAYKDLALNLQIPDYDFKSERVQKTPQAYSSGSVFDKYLGMEMIHDDS